MNRRYLRALIALLLIAALCFAGCGKKEDKKTETPAAEPTTEPTAEPTPEPAQALLGPEGTWQAIGTIREGDEKVKALEGIVGCELLLEPGGTGAYAVSVSGGTQLIEPDDSGAYDVPAAMKSAWDASWTWQDGGGTISFVGPKLTSELRDDRLLLWMDDEALVLARSENVTLQPLPAQEASPEGEWTWTGDTRLDGLIRPKSNYSRDIALKLEAGGKGSYTIVDNDLPEDGGIDDSGTYDLTWTWWEGRGTVTMWGEIYDAYLCSGRLVLWEDDDEALILTRP